MLPFAQSELGLNDFLSFTFLLSDAMDLFVCIPEGSL